MKIKKGTRVKFNYKTNEMYTGKPVIKQIIKKVQNIYNDGQIIRYNVNVIGSGTGYSQFQQKDVVKVY
tara:strand:+ start:452 stop:655 length:204 start_codon:yes stop_codon:yes gene_type:complete